MRFFSTLCFVLIFNVLAKNLAAQEPSKLDLAPCGTAPWIDPWLHEFKANPEKFEVASRSNDTLWVAMKIHLLARDNGTGRFSPGRLLDAFCRLNADFAESNIKFYFKDDWNLLNKTAWYDHDEITTGIQMMFANDVPGAVNAYFVTDPAGNCGYNIPYASVAIGHGCAGANDHTWAHEVGHNLTLPHPFIGWEGKIYNISNPTPTFVTYDYTHFHAQPDTIVPAPRDTALVELLDKSNCLVAADKHCDTRPDYLSYRWDCDAQNQSITLQRDPAGATFYSDGTLFMSYALDKCQSRFSPDEITTMRANLLNVKASYIAPGAVTEPVVGTTTLLEPLGGVPAPSSGATLRWTAVQGAKKYVVQGSRLANFVAIQFETVTSDTFYLTPPTPANVNIYWRVRPFNEAYTCTPFTAGEKYFATNATAAPEVVENEGVKIFPNLLRAGQTPTLEGNFKNEETLRFAVFNTDGRLVRQGDFIFKNQKMPLPLGSADLKPGVYRALLFTPNRSFSSSFVVLNN